jgi:hypothetical protein
MTSGCFQKERSAFKGRIFQDNEDVQKCYYGSESYSITGVPKTFPTVASLG